MNLTLDLTAEESRQIHAVAEECNVSTRTAAVRLILVGCRPGGTAGSGRRERRALAPRHRRASDEDRRMKSHVLVIDDDGTVRTIYCDDLRLQKLGAALGGEPEIRRASHVEPFEGGWQADMALSDGPKLAWCATRGEALALEVAWLRVHLLGIAGADEVVEP